MAKRVKRAPSLPNVTPNVRDSLAQTNRVLYQDGVEQNYRLNLAFPKDGTEPFEAPMPLQIVATVGLPDPTLFEGNIIYDTTTNTLKYSNGTAWVSLTAAPAVPALSINVQTFTSGGTYTPSSGLVTARIRVQAPGGGGGGADGVGAGDGVASGGGGGGEYAEGYFTAATIGVNQTVTIGTAGTAGSTTGGNGGTGGTSSVGALITAVGGSGGTGTGSNSTSVIPRDGGAGGTGGTGGHLRRPGGQGFPGLMYLGHGSSTFRYSGGGGASFLAGGRSFVFRDGAAGIVGRDYGEGGTGADVDSNTGVAGGAGGPSIVLIEEYIMS